MKKLYKILAFIAIIFILFKVYNYKKKMSVINHFNRVIPEDNFFYSDDLKSHWLLTYGTRYKGTVYSDKLREIKSKKGIPIYFSSLDYEYLLKESKNFRTWYENAFYYNEAESIVSNEARKTFGKDIIVYVDELYTPDDFIKFVELNKGKNAKYKIKCTMYIDVFVDDITKVNVEEYQKKLFNLYKYLYDYNNINPTIKTYIQDRKLLTYENITKNINKLFVNDPKVKKLLNKYKQNGKLNSDEMGYLMNLYVKYFDNEDNKNISISVQNYKKINNYTDIHIILPKEMRTND